MDNAVDLVVIGGGINGVGIARDAVGRGLKVLLCEQDDLAQHTSSASSKLIHGGLRYLEYYEFALVAKALAEREVLLRAAPHIIWPLRFVLPHTPGLRPAWLMRLGLWLYDWLDLGKRQLLPGSCAVDLTHHPAGSALQTSLARGFEYSDCWVDDARLVVLNALDAYERGGQILTRTRCTGAQRYSDHWLVTLEDHTGQTRLVRARALVNAAGPWVAQVLDQTLHIVHQQRMRLVKGSHIVLPALFQHEYAYIFQNPDQRVIFAIPYQSGRFTLVGTTEVLHHADPAQAQISAEEIDYLCQSINRYFRIPVQPSAVVHSFAGVRPLLEDDAGNPSAVTRDYRLELAAAGGAPLLSVFGGKLTTYRKLAEQALHQLLPLLGRAQAPDWTASVALPGGEIAPNEVQHYIQRLQQRYAWLPAQLIERYVRLYGTRCERLLANVRQPSDLGLAFGEGVYQVEVEYLRRVEWARTADDMIWRRTKLGLQMSAASVQRLQQWLSDHPDP